jgi:hypothetical protein
MKFTPNKEQIAAFKKVKNAIKEAQKKGLVFYGKSGNLVAYTKQADEYNNEVDFCDTLGNGFSQIECISETGLIVDSGADDYPEYRSQADEDRYS